MRRYDDPVEVRPGLVDGVEGPEQFLWRDRLWRVRAVVARWVHTAPWWEHRAVRGLLGAGPDDGASASTGADAGPPGAAVSVAALLAEQEVWRVDATRGRLGMVHPEDREVRGVFDLVRDGESGEWRLVGCQD